MAGEVPPEVRERALRTLGEFHFRLRRLLEVPAAQDEFLLQTSQSRRFSKDKSAFHNPQNASYSIWRQLPPTIQIDAMIVRARPLMIGDSCGYESAIKAVKTICHDRAKKGSDISNAAGRLLSDWSSLAPVVTKPRGDNESGLAIRLQTLRAQRTGAPGRWTNADLARAYIYGDAIHGDIRSTDVAEFDVRRVAAWEWLAQVAVTAAESLEWVTKVIAEEGIEIPEWWRYEESRKDSYRVGSVIDPEAIGPVRNLDMGDIYDPNIFGKDLGSIFREMRESDPWG